MELKSSFVNERCSEITALRCQWRYGLPVGLASPRRGAGDKSDRTHRRRFDSPTECRVRERGHGTVLGDEGKAVGCVPPTALLSLAGGVVEWQPDLASRRRFMLLLCCTDLQLVLFLSAPCEAAILEDGVRDHYFAAIQKTH